MKLGIYLLILGLLIAGAGAYAWQYYSPSVLGYRPQEAQQFIAMGIGGMVLGGGLAVGGIIRMVLKRSHLEPLKPSHKYSVDLPEFRDYARRKYPDALDDDLITMIEDLIERGRGDKGE